MYDEAEFDKRRERIENNAASDYGAVTLAILEVARAIRSLDQHIIGWLTLGEEIRSAKKPS